MPSPTTHDLPPHQGAPNSRLKGSLAAALQSLHPEDALDLSMPQRVAQSSLGQCSRISDQVSGWIRRSQRRQARPPAAQPPDRRAHGRRPEGWAEGGLVAVPRRGLSSRREPAWTYRAPVDRAPVHRAPVTSARCEQGKQGLLPVQTVPTLCRHGATWANSGPFRGLFHFAP